MVFALQFCIAIHVLKVLRVEAEGGFVARRRVNGQLGVSRALGDHCLKTCGTWVCGVVCFAKVKQIENILMV